MRASLAASISDSGARILALLGLGLTGTFLLWLPRPVPPTELPGLTLDRAAVRAQVDLDAKLVRAMPRDKATVSFDRLHRFAQRANANGGLLATQAGETRRDRLRALADVEAAGGERALDALRAQAAEAAIPGITGRLPLVEAQERIGALIEHMYRYGMARGTHIVAPAFIIRTLAKTRWNLVSERPSAAGLSPVERRAFYGWLALRAPRYDAKERLAALERYAKAGGTHAEEARATLLFIAGEAAHSTELWEALHRRTGNRRYWNHALAARQHAQLGP